MLTRSLLCATLASSLVLLADSRPADAQCSPTSDVFAMPIGPAGVARDGNIVYFHARGGVSGWDVTNPAVPVSLGGAVHGSDATDLALSGPVMIGTLAFTTPKVYDISVPGFPVEVSVLPVINSRACAVDGTVGYVGDVNTLRTFDLSVPAAPVALGSIVLGAGTIQDVEIAGTLAYVAITGTGLEIVDVSDPMNPALLGTFAYPNARGVAVVGTTAYFGGFDGILRVLDVSTPATPVELGSVAGPGGVGRDVDTFGPRLYFAGQDNTWVVDISDSSNPVVLGSVAANAIGSRGRIAEHGAYAYGNVGAGLNVLDFNTCQPTPSDLTLEAPTCQTDQDLGKAGLQVAYELWLRNPEANEVTGFQAFLSFDDLAMTYEGACSSYDSTVFTSHIQGIATAGVAAGELRLDGNTGVSSGTTGDELLATLLFTVAECDPVSVGFDLTQPFPSELSFNGEALDTNLTDSPSVVVDVTPPSITCPDDITVAADADLGDGCQGAIVTWSDPVVSDSCTGVSVVCTPPSGSEFAAGMTETVTCTATDDCGNETSCMFDVTVTETNVVCVDVQLVGVTTAPTRCIRFVTDDCGATADVALTFDGTGLFSGEIEVPCGTWTSLCAKDEQHTQWANGSLVLNGTKYELSGGPLELKAGDTDNDGDVDINDVTLFLAQQGGPEPAGTCPWDGSRGADFSNNGNVAAEDYSLMTPQWLTTSNCSCTSMLADDFGDDNVSDSRVSVLVSELDPWVAAQADLNRDRVVDYRDVEIFERRHGLAKTLSAKMKRSTPKGARR